jgi:hypothetical protein
MAPSSATRSGEITRSFDGETTDTSQPKLYLHEELARQELSRVTKRNLWLPTAKKRMARNRSRSKTRRSLRKSSTSRILLHLSVVSLIKALRITASKLEELKDPNAALGQTSRKFLHTIAEDKARLTARLEEVRAKMYVNHLATSAALS